MPEIPFCVWRCLVLAILVGVGSTGCGDAPETDAPDSVASSSPSDGQHETATESPSSTDAERETQGHLSERTKWIGEIPYDVFYDDPLAIAADEGIAVASSIPPASDTVTTPAGPSSGPPSAAGETDAANSPDMPTELDESAPVGSWDRLASIEVLNEESKRIRNRLAKNLQTVATYNRSLEDIANDAVILAAIAAVVDAHPGTLPWKEKAPAVRELASQVAAHSSGSGREAYSETQVPYEQLIAVLDGGPPPDEITAGEVSFSDVASRSDLMTRIKQSFEWLKSEINTESRFRESPEDIVREASLLALFGGLISTDSYDLSDEAQYQQFAREFVDGSVGMAQAITTDSFEEFVSARDRVQNSCAACHGEYALGDEGL